MTELSDETLSLEVGVRIIANPAGNAAIDRYVGLSPEQSKELATTPGMSRTQVLQALARAHLLTGHDAHRLDGWADTEPGDIQGLHRLHRGRVMTWHVYRRLTHRRLRWVLGRVRLP